MRYSAVSAVPVPVRSGAIGQFGEPGRLDSVGDVLGGLPSTETTRTELQHGHGPN